MVSDQRIKSDEHDARIVLLVGSMLDEKLKPLTAELRTINDRMAHGDTRFALIEQRMESLENSDGTSTALERKKPSLWDKFGVAILMGAAATLGGVFGSGVLSSLIQHGGKP